MNGYMISLVFLAFAIFALSIIQLQYNRHSRLIKNYLQLENRIQIMQNKLREREKNIDQIQRGFDQLSKWEDRASELAWELRAAKLTKEYAQAQRLKYLENYIASHQKIPAAQFLSTFQPRGLHTFWDRLFIMLENAEFEVVIVSPWIKRQMWDEMKGPLMRFVQRGGKLRVFMRGLEDDYSKGLSDDIHEDVKNMCGEIVIVNQLHAKIYMIDRKEAIVTSANLTKGGIENNYEAGAWLNDPTILKDICDFINSLYHYGDHLNDAETRLQRIIF